MRQRPDDVAQDSAQCQETPGGEDDSDTDLTYGEVEQRLDLLQQHLNRCAEEVARLSRETKRLHLKRPFWQLLEITLRYLDYM